jgi:phage terminase small subunit
MTNLTSKQDIFCREYLVDFNGTQAAIRAGYSAKTAHEQASQILAKLSIQQRLNKLIADREARIDRQGDEVLKRIWEVADLKVTEDVGEIENGEFIVTDSQSWAEATKRVVRSVKSTKTVRKVGKEEIDRVVCQSP